ncbi:MAG TPA: right-handed parallel beta-helix repeat-containing protein, partial [Terrimesophilobacter sp.]|nr:right-handed parallel beta-helix repeat-containing protein [Terrimesophilobacter sp.]
IVYPVSIVGPGMGTFTLDAANHRALRFDGSVNGVFDASVSGLTIEHAGITLSEGGIDSTDTNLQISTVTVTESHRGLDVVGGSVTVTDSFFTANINNGVSLYLENSSESEFLRVRSTGNGVYGVIANLDDSASLEIVDTQSNDNAQNGFLIDGYDQSSLTITDTTAELNDQFGFGLYLYDDVTLVVTNSSALNNAFIGFEIWAANDVEATVVGATANDNTTGFDIVVSEDSVATFTDTTATRNYYGVVARAFGSEPLEFTDTRVDDADEIGMLLYADNGATLSVDNAWVSNSGTNGVEASAEESGTSIEFSNSLIELSGEHGASIIVQTGAGIDFDTTTIRTSSDSGVSITGDDDATDSAVSFTDSTITDNGNSNSWGGGIEIFQPAGLTTTITRSTISNNEADNGGGIYVLTDDEMLTLRLVNSTVSGNEAAVVGGLYFNGEPGDPTSILEVLNSTITNNTTLDVGPGGMAAGGESEVTIRNSIIAGNNDAGTGFGDLDFYNTVPTVIEYSLVQSPSPSAIGPVTAGTGNLTGMSAQLGVLDSNGGPTQTHLPGANSPVINAGDPLFAALLTDQRGEDRIALGRLDMGAAEVKQLAATGAGEVTATLAGGILLTLTGLVLLAARGARRRKA